MSLTSKIFSRIFLFNEMTKNEFRDEWHSFDRTPWTHPWLTPDNLRAMASFSRDLLEEARRVSETLHDKRNKNYGFVCNVANSMYTTAKALRPLGAKIKVVPHPSDSYMMSQPEWEEYDGSLPHGVTTLNQAEEIGISFPFAEDIVRTAVPKFTPDFLQVEDFAKKSKYNKWCPYYSYEETIRELRKFDALFAIQAPYLAYLSERPYITTHMGGDIWYECSRDDMLGQLQRVAFSNANLAIASNPWSYAFARRYRMSNFICMPTLLNPDDYSPGEPVLREEWKREIGGDFFVLTTARADDFFKGSNVALEGFGRFCNTHSNARLILIGWGADLARHEERVRTAGLEGKILILPPAGKKLLIRYLQSAHVLLDQFILGYFGMTALEAIAVGKPVVMRLAVDQYQNFLSEDGPPPVINASTNIDVADSLKALADNPDYLEISGNNNRKWFNQYAGSIGKRSDYLAVLSATAAGYRFDYRESPLYMPLSKIEKEYHREQLMLAPKFPNYM